MWELKRSRLEFAKRSDELRVVAEGPVVFFIVAVFVVAASAFIIF